MIESSHKSPSPEPQKAFSNRINPKKKKRISHKQFDFSSVGALFETHK